MYCSPGMSLYDGDIQAMGDLQVAVSVLQRSESMLQR